MSQFLKNNYKIIEKSWFGYSWGLKSNIFITDNEDANQNPKLFVGNNKSKLLKDYDNVFLDEARTANFLQIKSIYETFKFRNQNFEPDTYKILDSQVNIVDKLQNGNRIVNNYWNILDENDNKIARLSKTVNFSGFLYDFTWILGHISFGILEMLILFIVSPIFPRLLEVKYTIAIDSQIIAELKRIIKPKSIVMEVKILDENHKIDERLILAAALRAFPGGSTFYPKNNSV
jgi:hypothetical protein